jgi:hypothetical protein
VCFRPAAALTPEAVAAIAEQVLHWFARRGLIEPDDVREMLAWKNSGFSLDAAPRIAVDDRAGPEQLLRNSARPLDVWYDEHCCQWAPKARYPFLAGSCPSPTRRHYCPEILRPSRRSHDPRQPDSTRSLHQNAGNGQAVRRRQSVA